jgi:Histidine kinase-like ATPase domain
MHGGHQAAPAGTAHDGGIQPPAGRPAAGRPAPPGQLRPPGLLPAAVAGPPGIAARAVGIEPESPRAAREFARETLLSWDMSAAFQDTAVVVSELVTNALCHGARVVADGVAPGQVEFSLWHRASHLVCAVTDPSAEPPVLRQPDPGSEAGRGLQVVQALATTWGWAMLGLHRKMVWAALRVPQACAGSAEILPRLVLSRAQRRVLPRSDGSSARGLTTDSPAGGHPWERIRCRPVGRQRTAASGRRGQRERDRSCIGAGSRAGRRAGW